MSKNPHYDFAYHQGRLDMYHEWSDLEDQWHDEAEELGYTNQWKIDSYIQDKTVKWMDSQRAESELNSTIATTRSDTE